MKKILLSAIFAIFCHLGFSQSKLDSAELESGPKPWQGLMIDLGWTGVNQNGNYYQSFPSLKGWGSRSVNIYYFYGIRLNDKFTIAPGLGVGLDGYMAKITSTRFIYNNDSISFFTQTADIDNKKSKLATNYIDIPLELRFKTGSSITRTFRMAIGAKAGILFDGHTKVKYERNSDGETVKVKQKDNYAINRFRYGLTARIGYGYLNAFGYYSLSNLFRDGRGPEVSPYTIGISFSPNFFFNF